MSDIAVVIPCFDLGRTIEEAVQSVLAQTRPADVVVVDDGSTDAFTRQRLATLPGPGVTVALAEHRGAAAARNRGVALTSAPYLLFLDGDDTLDPTYLEKTRRRLDEDPTLDFVSTAMRGFGEAQYVWTPPRPELKAALTRGTIPITALLRRRVWDAVGGFDETLPASMDLDFWITALERGLRGDLIDEPLLNRRVRSDSLHHSAVRQDTHRDTLARILRKHGASASAIGPELVVAKETFIVEQHSDRARLEGQEARLASEVGAQEARIEELRRELVRRRIPAVDLGDFRRLQPLSDFWGLERGKPVDRRYIEAFLESHRADIRGRVLEIKEPIYTERYGSAGVTSSDVLDLASDNPCATIVADLTRADAVASGSFDCFILTQTLHIIHDVRAALFHAQRILAPGGVLLATFPAVSRINPSDGGLDGGDHWRFTAAALRALFGELFPPASYDVVAAGNLKTCVAFLYGAAEEELRAEEMDRLDPRHPLVFCVRAVKPG